MKYTDIFARTLGRVQAGRNLHCARLPVSSLLALAAALGCAGGASAADSGEAAAATASVGSASTVEEVIVTARQRRHVEQFVSDQTIKVLDQDQIKAASAVGGAAKALALIPGVSAASYGATGSQKTTLSIDGIKLGWAGFSGGNPDNGSVGVSFDGAPMTNPGNGLWQTTLVPQASLLQTISVTYGPGNPDDRWYTNIGGGLNFTPVQPSATAGGSIEATYGSFNTRNIDFTLQTGDIAGWETVIAGGENYAGSFYTTPDGFEESSQNYAFFFKTKKSFADGDFSLGAYFARSGAYRPLATPVSPIPGVTLEGYQANAPLFSEQTTGFYTTLPGAVDWKYDTNAIRMIYSQLNLKVSSDVSFRNLAYGDYEDRLHYTPLHDYVGGSESLYEVNQPHSLVVGDKPVFDIALPMNDLEVGGFAQWSEYHSREQLFNPALGFINSPVPVPAGLMGSPTSPNGQYFSDLFEQVDLAAFVQDDFHPFSTLDITPGLRFIDWFTYFSHDEAGEFPNAVLYNPGGQLSQFPASQTRFARVEPSVGVNWRALPWLALYGNWARSYRQPENGGGTGPYVAIQASQVQLERGDFYQVGAKFQKDRLGPASDLSLDVSYYHLNFDNETIPTALASGGALLAFGSSYYQGVNIFAEASPLPRLYAFLNLGVVDATFRNFVNGSGTFTGVPVPNTPNENLNVGLYYQLELGETLIQPRISYQRTGSQYIYDNLMNITSTQKLPAFGTFNFSTEVDLPQSLHIPYTKRLSITLEIDNLFNKQYNAFEYISAGGLYGAGGYTNPTTVGAGSLLALPAPPRSIFVTLGAKF